MMHCSGSNAMLCASRFNALPVWFMATLSLIKQTNRPCAEPRAIQACGVDSQESPRDSAMWSTTA